MSAPYMKIVPPLNEYSLVCRGCLAESGEMKNIREWGMIDNFYHVTNIQLKHTDGISELLCSSCEDTLMMCKRFKTQCQQSDLTLKNIVQNQPNQGEDKNTINLTFSENTLTYKITAPDTNKKIYLHCPYKCQNQFIKKRDLITHLTKQHETDKLVVEIKYHCHINSCQYQENGKKHFTERKFLNQHILKVHQEKNIHCEECNSNFITLTEYNRHLKTCNVIFKCEICDLSYKNNEGLLVHLMRHHPALHEEYKNSKKAEKRKLKNDFEAKKTRVENFNEFLMDSPKRSFATQTLDMAMSIKNDVALPSWQTPSKTDEISTQTVFEDLLSLKSQNSEDDSLFFSETVSLSDIQTQFPEFGLSRSNKETLTDNQDLSMKSTQTCTCFYDGKLNQKFCESASSSPNTNLTSAETQTTVLKSTVKSDVMLSFSSAETQTCFDSSGGSDSF